MPSAQELAVAGMLTNLTSSGLVGAFFSFSYSTVLMTASFEGSYLQNRFSHASLCLRADARNYFLHKVLAVWRSPFFSVVLRSATLF